MAPTNRGRVLSSSGCDCYILDDDNGFGMAGDDGTPIVFETMIFGEPETPDGIRPSEDYQQRYATYHGAVLGHERACAMVRTREFPGAIDADSEVVS